jgi:tyrosyl-tRNA synthetase
MMNQAVRDQLEMIRIGTEEIIPEDGLIRKLERSLASGKPLRVKMGFDPSAPDIHLGHAVGLRKLRTFQHLGHHVVLIVGDYTGMVGDPSGRNSTRPRLLHEQVEANARTYLRQLFKVVDESRAEVRWNSEWFSRMSFMEVMGLAGRVTVARMLERDDFEKRYRGGQPISLHEFFYPLMQGFDSVAIQSDVEVGGTDQKFNLLMGRDLQEFHGMEPQVALTVPILEGTDGVQRMSKSLGNYIGIDEPARDMFGKVMSIPDAVMEHWYALTTDAAPVELREIHEKLAGKAGNPRDLKVQLAKRIVGLYHSAEAAGEAEAEFNRIFREGGAPDEIPEFDLIAEGGGIPLVRILTETGLVKSRGDARRMVRQNAVRIDGERVEDEESVLTVRREAYLVQVGKRAWARVRVLAKAGSS